MQKDIICDQLGPKELDWLINPVKFHGEMACQKQGVRGPIHVGPTTGLWPHHPRKVYNGDSVSQRSIFQRKYTLVHRNHCLRSACKVGATN